MRLLRANSALLLCLVPLTALLAGCGSSNKVASITITPSPVSLAYGKTVQLTATALNGSGATMGATFAWTSNNAGVTVSPAGGNVCGGTWNSGGTANALGVINPPDYSVCQPISGQGPVTANITATNGNVSATVQVFLHQSVDSVTIDAGSGPQPDNSGNRCVSTGQTSTAFTAKAMSGTTTVDLTNGATGVNPFQWTSVDTSVATIDSTGKPTAIGPGKTSIYATAEGINSTPVDFETCRVNQITWTTPSNGTISVTPNASQTVGVNAVDSKGYSIPSPGSAQPAPYPTLSWISTNLDSSKLTVKTQTVNTSTTSGVTTNVASPTPTATLTGATSGPSTLVVSCTPPSCNKNLTPVYSNPVTVTNSGSASYYLAVASSQSTTLALVNAGATSGTTFTLPANPNSLKVNRQGTKVVIGSCSGFSVVTNSSSATSLSGALTSVIGKVLAISPDGALAAVVGQAAGQTQNVIGVIDLSTASMLATFSIPGTSSCPVNGSPTGLPATGISADFSPDSQYLWVTVPSTSTTTASGARLYVYNKGVGSSYVPLVTTTATTTDVAFVAHGPFAYLVGDHATGEISMRPTCAPSQSPGALTASAPTAVRALPNASGAVALDLPSIQILQLNAAQTPVTGCPAGSSLTNQAINAYPLGTGSLTASQVKQFVVTNDSTKVLLTGTNATVWIYNLAAPSQTATPASLSNSPTLIYTGDVTGDSKFFYVGGNDSTSTVHVINLSTGSDSTTSVVQLYQSDGTTVAIPDLVGVINK